jgi:hypothetical protein
MIKLQLINADIIEDTDTVTSRLCRKSFNALHVKHFIALKKRESVRRIFFVYLPMRTTLVNTSTSELEKHEKYDSIGDKKRKNMCTHKTI